MDKRFTHLSVMAEVAPPLVVTDPDGTYVDATFGRGGIRVAFFRSCPPKENSSHLTVIRKLLNLLKKLWMIVLQSFMLLFPYA